MSVTDPRALRMCRKLRCVMDYDDVYSEGDVELPEGRGDPPPGEPGVEDPPQRASYQQISGLPNSPGPFPKIKTDSVAEGVKISLDSLRPIPANCPQLYVVGVSPVLHSTLGGNSRPDKIII